MHRLKFTGLSAIPWNIEDGLGTAAIRRCLPPSTRGHGDSCGGLEDTCTQLAMERIGDCRDAPIDERWHQLYDRDGWE